jgi:hypothetical protein
MDGAPQMVVDAPAQPQPVPTVEQCQQEIGRLHNVNADLSAQNTLLQQNFSALQQQFNGLAASVAAMEAARVAAQPSADPETSTAREVSDPVMHNKPNFDKKGKSPAPKDLPKFDPKKEDVTVWLLRLAQFFLVFPLVAHTEWVNLAVTCFNEPELLWWEHTGKNVYEQLTDSEEQKRRANPNDASYITPWRCFEEVVVNRFRPPTYHDDVYRKILNLRQGNRSCHDFFNEYESLVHKLHNDRSGHVLSEWDKKFHVRNALNDRLKSHMLDAFSDNATYDSIKHRAFDAERAMLSNGIKYFHQRQSYSERFKSQHFFRPQNSAQVPLQSEPMDLGARRATANGQQRTNSTKPFNKSPKPQVPRNVTGPFEKGSCFNCGSKAHFENDCPYELRPERKAAKQKYFGQKHSLNVANTSPSGNGQTS